MSIEIDKRIISLIKYSKHRNHRCCICLMGEESSKQIPVLYNVLAANSLTACNSIIWCHKKEKNIDKNLSIQNENLTEFIKTKDIQFISYNESEKILGQTIDLLVLQDFESLTPNLIALSIETVRGGGLIVLLLDNVESIESMTKIKSNFLLDDDFVPRYNKRLFRSLINSSFILFLNSACEILPFSKFNLQIENFEDEKKIKSENVTSNDSENILINMTRTSDQSNVVNKLFSVLKDRTNRSIFSIQAGRGRGKSVALGLTITRAIQLKFSSIYISAPALENVKVLFDFLIKGLNAIGYIKYKDFKIVYSFKSRKRLIQRIEILKDMKQTIEYFSPFDELKYHPDMLIVDEAAAIPLPILKKLLFPNLIIMATTISGYEGTGRAFSIKMSEYLKQKTDSDNPFSYNELNMINSIRYGNSDPVEKWLNNILLLNAEPQKITKCPIPSSCDLFYVDRDLLFSGHSHSEMILKDVFSLFIASHYKNSPNDIQILADSPSHEIFTLLTNVNENEQCVPRVLCAIHVSFEGKCKNGSSKKGNLIPWIISESHFDNDILNYLGIRIVRIAVHPDYMSMGYGSRALDLLFKFFDTNQLPAISKIKFSNEESILFYELKNVYVPKLSWIGTSFGLNERLMNFWKKHNLIPICVKQTVSFITGEYSSILLKEFNNGLSGKIQQYYKNFKTRFVGQLSYSFRNLNDKLCLILIFNKIIGKFDEKIEFSKQDLDRIDKYCRGTLDILQIIDIIPLIARQYFTENIDVKLNFLQKSILLMIGCQNKSVKEVSKIHKLKEYEVNSVLMKIFNIIYKK